MKVSTTLTSIFGAMLMAGLSAVITSWKLSPELIGALGTVVASLPAITERLKKGF